METFHAVHLNKKLITATNILVDSALEINL